MTLTVTDFSRAVEALYDAALDANRWQSALELFAGSTGSNNCSLHFIDVGTTVVGNAFYYKTSPEFARSLVTTYGPIWVLQAAVPTWQVGQPMHLPEILPAEEFRAGRFYREWLSPQGQGDYVGMVALRSGSRLVKSSSSRLERDGGYTAGQLQAFRMLAPHFCKAVRISDTLDVRALAIDGLEQTLAALRSAVLLLDDMGRIAFANAAAERLLEERRAITLDDSGRLAAADPGAAAALAGAIAAGIRDSVTPASTDGNSLALPDPRRGGMLAHVLPLRRGTREPFSQHFSASVAVFVQDPQASPPLPGMAFARLYNLTPRELQVVMTMIPDRSMPEVADILGISLATVRTHVSSVYSKTGTTRHNELMHLLLSGASPAG